MGAKSTVSALFNNQPASWAHLLVFIIITLVALGVMYGTLNAKMDIYSERVIKLEQNHLSQQGAVAKELQSICERLGRIEGRLGINPVSRED